MSFSSIVAQASPIGGQVVSGSGTINQAGSTTTITQSTQNLSLNWKSFNIAKTDTVNFVQPDASSIAINRIFDTNGTQILGHLNANGQVWLINPNGILFGAGSQINVGGLVASTLDNISSNGQSVSFSGDGTGSIVNQGAIDGHYVAFIGNTVSNVGTITSNLGAVAMGAGNAVSLTFTGNDLVKMQVDQSVLNSLAGNGGLIKAEGGMVIMSAGAKDSLLASVVNNTGVIEAQTVQNKGGNISLLGGMNAGTVNLGGTLDASAPNGGNGGFIETSAHNVHIAPDAKITTLATQGLSGTWLIDPQDFTIASSGGDETGAQLSSALSGGNVTILSSNGATAGSGDINVNDVVSWSANTLTLTAANSINVNAMMTGTGTASLALNSATANGVDSAVPGGATKIAANISTGGAQTYTNAVTLGANVALATTNSAVTFAGTLDNASPTSRSLTINAGTGNVSFGGAVGSDITNGPLGALVVNSTNVTSFGGSVAAASLTTNAGGTTTLGGNVTTSGAQTYTDAVTLGANATLASSGNGTIGFGSTLDGAQALTVNTSGVTNFGGAIGSTTALTSLTTDAGGTTTLGGNVTTSGAQTYSDAVTLGANATLASIGGGAIGLLSTVDGTHALTLNTLGATTFGGAVGSVMALTSLTTDAGGTTTLGGNVTTSGAQTYSDAVTLGANATLASSGGGTIGFGSTVDGAHNLTVNTGGLASFGGGAALNQLSITSGGDITQGGAFTVTGTSSFNAGFNAITLTNAGNDFGGAVNLSGGTTQVTDSNALTLGTLSTGALTVISSGALNLGSGSVGGNLVATSNNGAISQGGALTVAGSSNLQAGTGAITLSNSSNHFAGAVTAAGQGVTLQDVGNLTVALLSSGTNGTVSLIAGGTLSLPVSGINTGTANLTLEANGGSLTTPGTLQGGNITLAASGPLTLNSNVSSAGTVLLTSGSGISQTGGVITASTLSGSSTGSTTLGGANLIGTLGNLSAANFSLTNAQTLTVSGPLTTAGNTGTISLTTTSGALNLGTDLIGGMIALDSATGLNLSNNLTGSTLSLTAGGAIDQIGGALKLSGGTTINAGSNAITLTNAGNDFGGAVSLTGGTTQITDMNALTLGTLNTGALTVTSAGNMSLAGNVAAAGNATLNSGGVLSLGAWSVTGAGVTLNGVGITQSASSTVDGGSGDIMVNGGGGAVNLDGSLITTSNTATATTVHHATTVALGNITTGNNPIGASGTTILGIAGDITGVVTQNPGTFIHTGTLTGTSQITKQPTGGTTGGANGTALVGPLPANVLTVSAAEQFILAAHGSNPPDLTDPPFSTPGIYLADKATSLLARVVDGGLNVDEINDKRETKP